MNHYIGQLLDDRYEILEVIGTGGMAIVYKALDHRLNRQVAIKILKDEFSGDDEFRRRFRAEGEAVAMLSHPNIVQVYDVSSSDTANYLVMELIDGISLKQYMEVKGVLNWKETLHFALQIAKGLEHAHSRGIVHRDIKPHNVMVLKDGSVKVMDFGIARVMSKSNTLTKEALGSVHYISPEQAKGGYTDSRSDIYSLSVVMYEMMTGRPPFDGESPVAVLAIGAFLIAVFNGALLNKDKDLVEVPYLIGVDYSDELISKYSDFTIRFQPQQYDNTYQKGQIMAQEPAGGSKVSKGTEIVITVSLGEEPAVKIMENLVGVSLEEVKSYLSGQGFVPLIRQEASETVEAGKVIRTDPASGTELTDGQTVSVWVSTGPENVAMPNVVDMTREAALQILGEIRDIEVVEQPEASAYVQKGNVTRTDPKVGTVLTSGQKVTVYVSSGPESAAMPNVVGIYSETAIKQLSSLGFTNISTESAKSGRPKGEVIFQSVEQGTVLKLGEPIVLRLSDGSGPSESTTEATQATTETTEKKETTVAVRFTVPNREESYLLTILQDGIAIVEDQRIPAGVTDYTVELTGSGTKEYDLYVNGEKYLTQRVTFDG